MPGDGIDPQPEDHEAMRQREPLSFTFDHRMLDGEPAARFMSALHDCLQHTADEPLVFSGRCICILSDGYTTPDCGHYPDTGVTYLLNDSAEM